jgi:hypothetical protein
VLIWCDTICHPLALKEVLCITGTCLEVRKYSFDWLARLA